MESACSSFQQLLEQSPKGAGGFGWQAARKFEYDPRKSVSNKKKHGIDFEEAQTLWKDEDRLQIQARSDTESRFALIAFSDNKLWVALHDSRTSNQNHLCPKSERRRKEVILCLAEN